MTIPKLITSADPKGMHAVGLFEAAYNKAQLDTKRAQRLNERGGQLQEGILKLLTELTSANEFAKEEVPSHRVYPWEYRARSLAEQERILVQLFPSLVCFNREMALPSLGHMEALFAIPPWEAIAQTYSEALSKVFALLSKKRKLKNYCEQQFWPAYFRQTERSSAMWRELAERQKSDGIPASILIVPTQFGLLHRGRSARRARELFGAREFGLGVYATAIMLLTHPDRITSEGGLWIDCAGDEYRYATQEDSDFDEVPYWSFHVDTLEFHTRKASKCADSFGSASAILPDAP